MLEGAAFSIKFVLLSRMASLIKQFQTDILSQSKRVTDLLRSAKLAERVPTISFTHPRYDAQVLAEHLAERQIYAWNGNMYALELSALLGLEQRGGFLRLGLVHYNTADEVDAVLAALDQLAA